MKKKINFNFSSLSTSNSIQENNLFNQKNTDTKRDLDSIFLTLDEQPKESKIQSPPSNLTLEDKQRYLNKGFVFFFFKLHYT